MPKFPALSRKVLLNQLFSWQFCLAINNYPIVVYVNLHNINNKRLHQIKSYMLSINGGAQVLGAHSLAYLFSNNIKFKFLARGNTVALMFNKWQYVWDFTHQYKDLLICTISVSGVFLNICSQPEPINYLQELFDQHHDLMIKTTMQFSCLGSDIYSCLNQPMINAVNNISVVLYGLAQHIENLSNIQRLNKIN